MFILYTLYIYIEFLYTKIKIGQYELMSLKLHEIQILKETAYFEAITLKQIYPLLSIYHKVSFGHGIGDSLK